MKKYLLTSLLFFLTSCSLFVSKDYNFDCPSINLSEQGLYLTRTSGTQTDFRIELLGFDNYCYRQEDNTYRYSIIIPKFKIIRLNNSDETDIHFTYYTDILQGPPEFLGKKIYFVNTTIGLDEKEKEFIAKPSKVRIPYNNNNIDLEIGLELSGLELRYNSQDFDSRNKSLLNRDVESVSTSSSKGCTTCQYSK